MTNPILWTSTHTSGSIAHQAAMVSGLAIDIRFISLRAGDARKPDYLAINPKGEVPALQLPDGAVITEMPAVIFWLGEAAPGSGLLPAGATARAKAMEWLAWCHWTMGRHFNPAFGPLRFAGGDEAAAVAVRAAAAQRALQALAFADAALVKAGGTLLGTDQPTGPDIFLGALATFAGFLRLDIAGLDALAALGEQLRLMPGVAAANAREQAQG
jgi:glutathione S-transferase